MKYKAIIEYDYNQTPLLKNEDTGKLTQAITMSKEYAKRNIPDGKVVHAPGAQYNKSYSNVRLFLDRELTTRELGILSRIKTLVINKKFNNLKPLSDKTTVLELAKFFKVGKNTITPIITKFKFLGIIGVIEIVQTTDIGKYWILNPYITYNGKLIDEVLAVTFKGTHIYQAFLDKNYEI